MVPLCGFHRIIDFIKLDGKSLLPKSGVLLYIPALHIQHAFHINRPYLFT